MGSLTKALIGKEDVDVADNELYPSTFNRLSSTGSTIALTSFPDVWKTHSGAINAKYYGAHTAIGATLDTAVADSANNTCKDIYLDAGEWVITSSYDWSSYTTVRWIFAAGAYLSIGAGLTVTFPSPSNIIAAPNQQIFSGTGTVAFSKPGTVYAAWWYSSGDYDTAIASALASLPIDTVPAGGSLSGLDIGGTVELPGGTITKSTINTIPSNVKVKGNGTTIQYSGTGVAFRFFVSGDKVWYSSIEDIDLTDTGTGTIGIGIYNGQFCNVSHCRVDSFATGILMDGDDGAGTEGCYNNLIFECDLDTLGIGIDMSSAYVNQNRVIGGRIRLCDTNWIKLGNTVGPVNVSSNLVQGVNFVDIDPSGAGSKIGITLTGRKNSIVSNRFEQSADYAGDQTYVQIESGSYANYIAFNAFVSGVSEYRIVDSSSDDNIIIDALNDTFQFLSQGTGTPTLKLGGGTTLPFTAYTTAADATLAVNAVDVIDLVPTASAIHVTMKGGVQFKVTGKGDVTAHQTFTPGDTWIIMNPSDGHYNLNPSGTFGGGHIIIVRNTNGVANNIMFDSTGANVTIAAGKSRIFGYNGANWALLDFT